MCQSHLQIQELSHVFIVLFDMPPEEENDENMVSVSANVHKSCQEFGLLKKGELDKSKQSTRLVTDENQPDDSKNEEG